VASHEFFHIITPLSIHAKEIQYYDYLNPVLSKHLWLVAGTKPLPFKETLLKVGFEFDDNKKTVKLMPNLTDKQLVLRRYWVNE
jgi:M61 glycyl aminopeptidase